MLGRWAAELTDELKTNRVKAKEHLTTGNLSKRNTIVGRNVAIQRILRFLNNQKEK